MVLKLVRSPKRPADHLVDIIAIPAIGASPEITWGFPQDHSPPRHPQYIWNNIHSACVYLYKFNRLIGQQEYSLSITKYAEVLLAELGASEEIGKRPIHFAAHSTGGLVLKQALVLALKMVGEQQGRNEQIRKKCSSIAFFGVPHGGSTVLSDDVYKDAVREELQLDKPLGIELQKGLKMMENSIELRGFSHDFQPLTLSMKKIWSFCEFRESYLRVKVVVRGPAGIKSTTSTKVKSAIVDKRSAVMTAEGFLIGCEEAVIVNATHASLPRFGDNPDAMEFSNYIKALKSLIECASTEQSLENEEKCRAMIEEEVLAEVHQFYDADGREGSETIRLWSVNPTLHELFQHGPSSFLSKRSEEAKLPIPTGNSQMPEPSMAQSNFTPSGPGLTTGNLSEAGDTSAAGNQQIEESALQEPSSPATNNFPSTSDNSRGSYNIPDPRQYLFRWIHVPANNMPWVENTLRSIDREVALKQKIEAADASPVGSDDSPSVAGTPASEPVIQPSDLLERANTNPALSQLLKGAVVLEQREEDANAKDLLVQAVQDPAQAVKLLEVSQLGDPRQPAQMSELPSIVTDIREQASMLKTAAQMQRRNEEGNTEVTGGQLLAALNKAVLKAPPSLVAPLLHPRYWNLSQFKPNHDRPHGRYMIPGFHAFYPNSQYVRDPDGEPYLYSASENAQFVLYFPYLHWDNYGCMKSRNELVSELVEQKFEKGLDFRPSPETMQSFSTEQKLIFQYLFNSADLPLQIRRTLDQFGYPNLENTMPRDFDQVVFKWARDANAKLKERVKAKKKHAVDLNIAQLRTMPSIGVNMIRDEKDLKVLMVDQLWCWIINEDNVATFFPAKEEASFASWTVEDGMPKTSGQVENTEDGPPAQENTQHASHKPPSKDVFSPADLRDEIYDDMNGDPMFQERSEIQCNDCLDFMARTIWHAVTLFLDDEPGTELPSNDLRIFQIFEERICDLSEKANNALKELGNLERQNSRNLASADYGRAAKNLQAAVAALDNSNDLFNLLEAHDVVDELHILVKLFNQQIDVIKKMIVSYKKVDQLKGEPEKHARPIQWLTRAQTKVDGYKKRCKELSGVCEKTIDMYKHLLEMKEKEASIVELSCARISSTMATRQGYAMMTFTIVTVLFLPLSFFTSLFGMNVRDWTGDERNSTLHRVMILMGSASAAIIVIALLAAFFPLWFGGATKGAEKMKKLRKKVADASPGLTRITRWQRPEVHEEMEEELSVESEDEKDEKSVVKEAEAERTSKWFWPGWSWGMRRT